MEVNIILRCVIWNCNWNIKPNLFSSLFFLNHLQSSHAFLIKQNAFLGTGDCECVSECNLLLSIWHIDFFFRIFLCKLLYGHDLSCTHTHTKQTKKQTTNTSLYNISCYFRHPTEMTYFSILAQERRMMETFPYLLNINEDPQLSWVLKHFIQDGKYILKSWRQHINSAFCNLTLTYQNCCCTRLLSHVSHDYLIFFSLSTYLLLPLLNVLLLFGIRVGWRIILWELFLLQKMLRYNGIISHMQ